MNLKEARKQGKEFKNKGYNEFFIYRTGDKGKKGVNYTPVTGGEPVNGQRDAEWWSRGGPRRGWRRAF